MTGPSLSLPRGAAGSGEVSLVSVLMGAVLPLSMTLADGFCQSLLSTQGGEVVLVVLGGGATAAGAGGGVGC